MDIDLRILPYGVRKVVEVLGLDAALVVLHEQQGQLFFIPEFPDKTHRVVEVFGLELANYWADQMPKQHYQVPMVDKVMQQLRNQQICTELDNKTATKQQLVRRYRLTRQQITNIYREHKLATEQLDTERKQALAQLDLLFE